MQSGTKYFTAPIREEERKSLRRQLGFHSWSFDFYECFGDYILQAEKMEMGNSTSLLSPKKYSQVPRARYEFHTPSICFEYKVAQFFNSPQVPFLHFWEAFSPLPLGRYSQWKALDENLRVHIFSEEFAKDLNRYWEALSALELWMRKQVLSLISIERDGFTQALLFHYEKGKCVRVGSDSKLYELTKTHQERGLEQEDMIHMFSEKSDFIYLNLNDVEPSLKALNEAIRKSLEPKISLNNSFEQMNREIKESLETSSKI